MAAKEEAAILKHLKKNPSQDALEISFEIDFEESVIKEALASLESKSQVESKEVDGRRVWSLPAPKKAAPATAAPKVEKAEVASDVAEIAPKKIAKADVVADDAEECCCAAGGVSKCFVASVGVVVLVLAVVIGYILGGMQATSAAKALADNEIKAVRDSIGLTKVALNRRLDDLESQIRYLKVPAKVEEPAADAKKDKKAPAKPAKKKRK